MTEGALYSANPFQHFNIPKNIFVDASQGVSKLPFRPQFFQASTAWHKWSRTGSSWKGLKWVGQKLHWLNLVEKLVSSHISSQSKYGQTKVFLLVCAHKKTFLWGVGQRIRHLGFPALQSDLSFHVTADFLLCFSFLQLLIFVPHFLTFVSYVCTINIVHCNHTSQGWLKWGNAGTAFRAEQGPCEPSKGLVSKFGEQ